MKKEDNLVATLLAVYAIILTLCIAIYAIFKLLKVDITLATNLLIWSATIFAPIAVLMTYTSWREQKKAELLSNLAQNELKRYAEIINELNKLDWSFQKLIRNQNYTDEKKIFDKLLNKLVKIRFLSNNKDISICFYLSNDEIHLRQTLETKISQYINLLIAESEYNLVKNSVYLDSDRIVKHEDEMTSQHNIYRNLLTRYVAFDK